MNSLPPSFPPRSPRPRPEPNNAEHILGRRIVRHAEIEESRPTLKPSVHISSGAATIAKSIPRHENQDRFIDDPTHGVFAVFDGVGSHKQGGAAAEAAARHIRRATTAGLIGTRVLAGAVDLRSIEAKQRRILTGANDAIKNEVPGAQKATTATLAEVIELRGETYAVWSSIGDSRIYHHDIHSLRMKQLSEDEGEGNVLRKFLGGDTNSSTTVTQSSHLRLNHGDGLVLVTDGVTGDTATDMMHPNELEYYYSKGVTAADAARNLIEHARKIDDRTAVVVRIGD